MFKNAHAFSSFSVDNLEKAKEFYNGTLGLDIAEKTNDYLMLKIAEDHQILVYLKSNHQPATFTILNFPVKDIEKTIEDLKRYRIQFEKYDQPDLKTDEKDICHWDGISMAWFKDPAGNILSLIEEQ